MKISYRLLRNISNLTLTNLTPKTPVVSCQRLFLTGQTRSRFSSKLSVGIGLGLVLVGGVSYYETFLAAPTRTGRYDPKDDLLDEPKVINYEDIVPTRQCEGPLKDLGVTLTLFQYESCPFCCKVRAFLNYYGFSYNVVEVHPVLRKELSFSQYKKVPVLLIGYKGEYKQLNDSTLIISVLSTFLLDPGQSFSDTLKKYPTINYFDKKGKKVSEVGNMYFVMYGEEGSGGRSYDDIAEEREWRRWVDAELVHMISPNVYRTFAEAKATFYHFSKRGDWDTIFTDFEQKLAIYGGTVAMYLIAKMLKSKYHLKKDVRESLYEAANKWTRAIGEERRFMGGKEPNLADLAVFGCLNSMDGCQAFEDMMNNTGIDKWYNAVQKRLKEHAGSVSALVKPKNVYQ